jgi:hypothetical protein
MNQNLYYPKQNINQTNFYDNNYDKKIYNNNINYSNNFKPKSYNGIFIAILTVLYVLFINKISDMLSSSNNTDDDAKISSYVMIVYFISVMGLVVAYVWLIEQNNGNYVIRKSLTFGGIAMLLYTIVTYWDYLDDYAKLIMLALSISCVIYYSY